MREAGAKRPVYVVAKTYPHPSQQYVELVCTAGVSEGRLIRLYPIPFRYLDPAQQFRKYSWLEATVEPRPSQKDNRPDSFQPDPASIRVTELARTPADWDRRRQIILPLLSGSMEEVQERYDETRVSLGMFKPKGVPELKIRESASDWTPKQRLALQQSRLWDGMPKKLEKIPYEFRYLYECASPHCRGHGQLITDWELQVACLKWRKQYGEDRMLEMIGQKWQDWMWRERDSYLIVGNTHRFRTFIVIGTFYPPRTDGQQTYLPFDAGA